MKFKKDNRDEIIKICDDLENEKSIHFIILILLNQQKIL